MSVGQQGGCECCFGACASQGVRKYLECARPSNCLSVLHSPTHSHSHCHCLHTPNTQRQKQHTREEQQQASAEREATRTQLRALKDRLPRRVAADGGEAELRDLEFRLAHESNQPSEEKQMQARIKELTAARPAFREAAQLEAKLKENNEARDVLGTRLQSLNAQLDGISAALDAEKQSVEAQKSSQAMPDQSSLNAEKQEVRQGCVGVWVCVEGERERSARV